MEGECFRPSGRLKQETHEAFTQRMSNCADMFRKKGQFTQIKDYIFLSLVVSSHADEFGFFPPPGFLQVSLHEL